MGSKGSRRRKRVVCVLPARSVLTLPNQMTSVFSESNSRRICHSTSMSTLLVLSASFNYDNYAASDVLLMTTLSLHSFMRSSQAESIIAAVSWLALQRRWPTSCNVSSTWQHGSSRTRASSTRDSLISGEVSYTGWTLSTGFGSESASRCSDVCTRWLLNTCRPTAVIGKPGFQHISIFQLFSTLKNKINHKSTFIKKNIFSISHPFPIFLYIIKRKSPQNSRHIHPLPTSLSP